MLAHFFEAVLDILCFHSRSIMESYVLPQIKTKSIRKLIPTVCELRQAFSHFCNGYEAVIEIGDEMRTLGIGGLQGMEGAEQMPSRNDQLVPPFPAIPESCRE